MNNELRLSILSEIKKLLYVNKDLFTLEEAAEYTGKAPRTIYNNRRKIGGWKNGHSIYFEKNNLIKWMKKDKIMNDDERVMEANKHLNKAS